MKLSRFFNSRKNSFTFDVLKLAGGTTSIATLNIIIVPILSRLYTPEAFGISALFVSITGILTVISCLRYEMAILLPASDKDAANILAASFLFVIVISSVSFLAVALARTSISEALKTPDLEIYLWFLPIALAVNGAFLALNYWNSRTKHFGRLSIAQVFQSVTKNGVQLGIGTTRSPHAEGLIGGVIVGSIVATVILGSQIWQDNHKLFLNCVRWRRIVDVIKRYRKFPLVDSWGSLINSASAQLPALMLAIFFSQTIVGYFALALYAVQLPMTLLGQAIGQVFFQRASEIYGKKETLVDIVEATFQRLFVLGLFPTILLTVMGRVLFIIVFGEEWAEAGTYVQILSFWLFFRVISSPLSTLFVVMEHQEYILTIHIALLITRIVSLTVGGLFNDVYLALGLFSGSGVLVYAGLSVWTMKMVGGISLYSLLRKSFLFQGYSISIVFILLLFKWYVASSPLLLVISGFSVIFYVLLVLTQEKTLRQYILHDLLRVVKK